MMACSLNKVESTKLHTGRPHEKWPTCLIDAKASSMAVLSGRTVSWQLGDVQKKGLKGL